MATKTLIKDNGNLPLITLVNSLGIKVYELPEPSEYEGLTSTIVDGSRNAKGYYVGKVVRSNVAKISVKWKYLTTEQWASILSHFNGEDTFTGYLKYYDQTLGGYALAEFYISDRKAGIFKRDPNNQNRIQGWTNCTINFVEV